MNNYEDYDDFSLGSNFGSKTGTKSKKDNSQSCYSSKHVRRVTEIAAKTKTKTNTKK